MFFFINLCDFSKKKRYVCKNKNTLEMKFINILVFIIITLNVCGQTFDLNNFTNDTINYTNIDSVRQGIWEESIDGTKYTGEYKDGKKNGVWYCYNDYNQKIQKLETFKDGLREGIYLEFNPNGIIIKEEFYKKGLLHGICKEYDVWDLKTNTVYINGKIQGIKKSYYTNMAKSYEQGVTNIMEESFYLDGLKNGSTKWYNKNDKLLAQYNYVNDTLSGEQLTFYEDGTTVKTKENYKNNKLHGLNIEYFPNGIIKIEGYYDNGEKSGIWKEYDEKGKLIKTYKNKEK